MKKTNSYKFAFWGTPQIAVYALDELSKHGLLPSLIVTAPDKPRGRGMYVSPPPAKEWAGKNGIPVYQPATLKDAAVKNTLAKTPWDFFLVIAYGKLIPREIFELPRHKTLNIHPSLLPKLRGPSPIQTAILKEYETGVSIMLLNEKMDEGPILARRKVMSWGRPASTHAEPRRGGPPKESALEEALAREGARLLAEIIPGWIAGTISPHPQEHADATYTRKFNTQDALLDLNDAPEKNVRKIRAFETSPRAYFFAERHGNKLRIIVTDAELTDGELVIKKVVPEGKKEMNYADFLKNT